MKIIISAIIGTLIALVAPILTTMVTIITLVFLDMALGIWANYKGAQNKKEWFCLSATKLWKTINKIFIISIIQITIWQIDKEILHGTPINLFLWITGFISAVELISILENCYKITGYKGLLILKNFGDKKLNEFLSN